MPRVFALLFREVPFLIVWFSVRKLAFCFPNDGHFLLHMKLRGGESKRILENLKQEMYNFDSRC